MAGVRAHHRRHPPHHWARPLERDDRVDLDVRALRQRGHADRDARGWLRSVEERSVDLVHAREVAHVGEVDGAADRVRQRAPGRLAHGGEVRVTSELGQGSVFEIDLPLEPAAGRAAGGAGHKGQLV